MPARYETMTSGLVVSILNSFAKGVAYIVDMVPCPHCGEMRKPAGLNRHIWRAHTEEGRSHIGFRKGTHDEATREKLSIARAGQTPAQGHMPAHTGMTFEEFFGPEKSDIVRAKIAVSMNGNRNGKQRKDRVATYNGKRMDSGWEVGVAAYLDEHAVEWKHEERRFLLSDGRYYHPDFSIFRDGVFSHLIEVKGWFRPESRLKFDLFKTDHPDVYVEVWDKQVLRTKGIIDASDRFIRGLSTSELTCL